jgi:hypothetical protein
MKSENTAKLSSLQKMNINQISYYENASNVFQKAFVSLQSNCSLCTTNLELSVSVLDNGEIKEEAFCPQCELKLRSKSHTVQ